MSPFFSPHDAQNHDTTPLCATELAPRFRPPVDEHPSPRVAACRAGRGAGRVVEHLALSSVIRPHGGRAIGRSAGGLGGAVVRGVLGDVGAALVDHRQLPHGDGGGLIGCAFHWQFSAQCQCCGRFGADPYVPAALPAPAGWCGSVLRGYR